MDERKKPGQLMEVIQAALAQADRYDRQLFEPMKVKTLWLKSYKDIPEVLKAIAQHHRRAQPCITNTAQGGARKVRTGIAV
jgi:hypothetical protein